MPKPTFYVLGEGALTVSFGNSINKELSQQVFKLYNQLLKAEFKFWLDLIPAYATLTIVYNPVHVPCKKHQSPSAWVKFFLEQILLSAETTAAQTKRSLTIPVCYHLEFGVDSLTVCKQHKVSIEELIAIHTQTTYLVYMLGFLPGFAYMGSVDPRIATPRLATPRTKVPSGSVGIAGEQTGIYPLASPGGWNIIGRTPLKLFDAKREEPVLLQPGDEVSFAAISKNEFENFDVNSFNSVAS